MRFVVATHNQHKLQEVSRILAPLGVEVITVDNLPDTEETGETFAENAYLKAADACRFTGLPAIADDSGLTVDALNGAPGVYTARYAGENATDLDRMQKLVGALDGVVDKDRTAQFRSAICCVFPNGDMLTANGACHGRIGYAPRGENGFGYDPIFLTDDFVGKTMAEITAAQKDAISHRGAALRAFAAQLQSYLDRGIV